MRTQCTKSKADVVLFTSLLHVIQGIYTSDSLDKSMDYLGYGSTGFVLLNEVNFVDF